MNDSLLSMFRDKRLANKSFLKRKNLIKSINIQNKRSVIHNINETLDWDDDSNVESPKRNQEKNGKNGSPLKYSEVKIEEYESEHSSKAPKFLRSDCQNQSRYVPSFMSLGKSLPRIKEQSSVSSEENKSPKFIQPAEQFSHHPIIKATPYLRCLPFKLDLYAIHGQRGIPELKKKLCKSIWLQLLLIVFLSINVYFIEAHFQKPTESIYLTYKYWWISANCFQLIMRLRHILSAVTVMCSPETALNRGFLICNKVIHMLDKYLLFPTFFFSVFVLDLINYVIDQMQLYSNVIFYKDQPPTFVEHILTAIIQFHIGVAILLLITDCFIKLLACYKNKIKKNIICKFDKAKTEKWKFLERELMSKDHICVLCSEQFEENDGVITLRCDTSHVFHRNCFSKYIKYQKDRYYNHLKCPMCQQKIEFNI